MDPPEQVAAMLTSLALPGGVPMPPLSLFGLAFPPFGTWIDLDTHALTGA